MKKLILLCTVMFTLLSCSKYNYTYLYGKWLLTNLDGKDVSLLNKSITFTKSDFFIDELGPKRVEGKYKYNDDDLTIILLDKYDRKIGEYRIASFTSSKLVLESVKNNVITKYSLYKQEKESYIN